jgi:hypothetical protein|tara:strand:- start:750 stop:899 length:150 start_codon:yes stop_codon:yes gene_type:complete
MVSQRDLENVVAQINSSYSVLVVKVNKLEEQVAALTAPSTLKSKSKEKD